VRELKDITAGVTVVRGAEWLPASRIGQSGCPLTQWPSRPPGPVLLTCGDGVASLAVQRSEHVRGLTDVYCVEGGVRSWEAANLPTASTADDILPLAFH